MANHTYTDEEIKEKIRAIRREYDRHYRATHKEQCIEKQRRYWERRAMRELDKERAVNNGGNG